MLLAIDTSTKMVGVALYDGAQVLGETLSGIVRIIILPRWLRRSENCSTAPAWG